MSNINLKNILIPNFFPKRSFERVRAPQAGLFSGSYHSGGQQSFLGVRLEFLGYGWIEGGNSWLFRYRDEMLPTVYRDYNNFLTVHWGWLITWRIIP